ncbi:hypothetical protein BEH93_08120 [Streptomyces sp. 2R]|nr:hypothetical protein BEH93_08120 [Streptomyces sp. 2R]
MVVQVAEERGGDALQFGGQLAGPGQGRARRLGRARGRDEGDDGGDGGVVLRCGGFGAVR